MPKSAPLKRIRLTLARSKEFPGGSLNHGYEFDAPLDASGHIDPAAWRAVRERCRVKRFWGGEEQSGRLIHRPGGAERGQWVFDYNPRETTDDEPGYRFASHAFIPGEYVSIAGHDGEMHTFRVESVTAVV
jgi:hypothetical protein